MKMGYRFSPVLSVVDHEPEPILDRIETLLRRDLSRNEEEMTKQSLIGCLRLAYPGNGLLGNHENMSRSLGGNVVEREGFVILVDNIRRNLSRDDLFEQGHGAGSGGDQKFHVGAIRGHLLPGVVDERDDFVLESVAAAGPLLGCGKAAHAVLHSMALDLLSTSRGG